jgi:O-antigen/teichoic acid export membrane protein
VIGGPLRPRFDRALTIRLMKEALPMGLVAALLSVGSLIPSYLLEHWHGHEALGRFSPVLYLLAAGNLVVLASGSAALPRLASYHQTGNGHGFIRLALKLITLCVAVGVLGLALAPILGDTVLGLLYGPAYANDGWILTGLMVAALCGWLASACGYCLTAARRLLIQIPVTAIASGSALIAGCLLIPTHGVVGAVWASGIFGAFLAAGSLIVAIQTMRSIGVVRPSSSAHEAPL